MQDRIFYHMYPLGLLGAPKINTSSFPAISLLENVEPWLFHIRDLGCNALYLGPVFESSSHGYDTIDYYKVDRRLGSRASLQKLIAKAKNMGFKVILDAVFNHVGRDFWAFKDLRRLGEKSKYKYWFSNVDFNRESPLGDSFMYDAWNGHYQLVELNLANPEVQEHIFGVVRHWIDYYAIDGLRLDAADVMDLEFLETLVAYVKNNKPNFWLMGEVVQGNYNDWMGDTLLDAVTNYEYHTPMFESFNRTDFSKIATILDRQYGPQGVYANKMLYTFVDNHDVDRAASKLNKPEHLFPLYLLLFTVPGIPAIYYGSEWGFEGKKQEHSDHQLRPKVILGAHQDLAKHPLLFDAIKRFGTLRKNHKALRQGSYQTIMVNEKQFVFSRTIGNEHLIIIINASQNTEKISVPLSHLPAETYTDVLNQGYTIVPKNKTLNVEVPSCWGRILSN